MDIFSMSASLTLDLKDFESSLARAQTGFSGICNAAAMGDSAVKAFASSSADIASSLGTSFANAWHDVKDSWGSAGEYFAGIADRARESIATINSGILSIGQSSAEGDFGYGTVDFASSSLGKTSAAQINTMIAENGEQGGAYNINLILDGRTLANVLFDPLSNTVKQKGVMLGA